MALIDDSTRAEIAIEMSRALIAEIDEKAKAFEMLTKRLDLILAEAGGESHMGEIEAAMVRSLEVTNTCRVILATLEREEE